MRARAAYRYVVEYFENNEGKVCAEFPCGEYWKAVRFRDEINSGKTSAMGAELISVFDHWEYY